MKKNLLLLGFIILSSNPSHAKDCFVAGNFKFYGYQPDGFLHYTIPYCQQLPVLSFVDSCTERIPDSTNWYLNFQFFARTYGHDTFYIATSGSWSASMYLHGFSYSTYQITIDFGVPCPSPSSGFSVTKISSTKATLKWNTLSCAIAYKIRYRADGTSSWTKRSVDGNTGLKKLWQLYPNTTYQWGVRTKCVAEPNVFSDFSPTQTFTTANLRDETEYSVITTELIVYPNPASENVFIRQSSNETAELKIMNYLGQIVMEKVLDPDNSDPVIISFLPSGNYFAVIQYKDRVATGEFIKE